MDLVNSVVVSIEKLLTIVNTTKKLLILIALTMIVGFSLLGYRLIFANSIIETMSPGRIERVGGRWCYQRKRGGLTTSRIVGIQFPFDKSLSQMGVEESLTAFVLGKEPSLAEFNVLCDRLVVEVLSVERQEFLYNSYPESKQKLYEYFQRLEKLEKDRQIPLGAKQLLKPLVDPLKKSKPLKTADQIEEDSI